MKRKIWYICVDEKVIVYSNGLDGSNSYRYEKRILFQGAENQCTKWFYKNNGPSNGYYFDDKAD